MEVLAARGREVHAARVWLPLGHPSWESYCPTECISRALAYRLRDVARALAAIHGAVAVGTETSRTRDTGPAAAATPDYSLSQRALIAVSSRSDDVAELITRRLAALAHNGLQALDAATVRAVLRQAVPNVCPAPPPPPADRRRPRPSPPCAPSPKPRRQRPLGRRADAAPAYLSGTAAADVLATLCIAIGETRDRRARRPPLRDVRDCRAHGSPVTGKLQPTMASSGSARPSWPAVSAWCWARICSSTS
ncbi:MULTISPECIES: hypothetical protein [unclassified Streptomyces]|uniref:hypothetical protein n=1 Tax=unclassified Streptomyces TaxID=2593676 RepID=UPI0033A97B37